MGEFHELSVGELESLLDAWGVPAAVVSPDYRILAANRLYGESFGESGVRGRHCYEVSHGFNSPCDQCGEGCPILHTRETGEPSRVLHVHRTVHGDEHEEVFVHPIHDQRGGLTAYLEVLRPVSSATTRPEVVGLVGRSQSFNRMLELVHRVAPSETTVLLLGETGTGKELVAQAVHRLGPRSRGGFVPLDCSGLTETLFESELFGHEKGAFTGAAYRKKGLVEAAEGGTLFLDEVGDIPLALQVKLLRLLETGTYRRVGSPEQRRADFRLICATHRDLEALVEQGAFRADLYYRISAFPIPLPPLRERVGDIPLLVEAMLRRVSPERPWKIHPAAVRRLEAYGFPGNVRELVNLLERAVLLTDGDTLLPEHLPEKCCGPAPAEQAPDEIVPLEEAERRYLRWALARHRGDRRKLARKLGLSERTLYRKLQEVPKADRARP
jgi:two-component system, NtrC family, response regulator HydG